MSRQTHPISERLRKTLDTIPLRLSPGERVNVLFNALDGLCTQLQKARSNNPEAWAEFTNEVADTESFYKAWDTAIRALEEAQ